MDNLPDPQNRNPKPGRPAVVIERLGGGVLLLLVAATGSFEPDQLADDEILLPYGHPGQRSAGGFTKPTVAKCTWLAIVRPEDCRRFGGVLPGNYTAAIALTVKAVIATGRHELVRDDRRPAP